MQPVFITGTGTGIGKTVVAAIVTQALEADYWKPVQAGLDGQTDSEWVRMTVENMHTNVHPETYKLKLAASPHIAAREEGLHIGVDIILSHYHQLFRGERLLVIEGAGGLMVPLNQQEFVIDLAEELNAKLILVSRNYLGSINHSLLTAELCKSRKLDVAGWIFNDQYMNYEEEIVQWSGIPMIASIPFLNNPGTRFVTEQSSRLKEKLEGFL